MSFELAIQTDRDGPELASLTQDLCNTLNTDASIPASVKSGTPAPGHKGEPITLGLITITFITSGAAVALFQTIKSFFDRSKTLSFNMVAPDGATLSMTSKNVSAEERERTLTELRTFLDRKAARP